MKILNLTQHIATKDQQEAGVIEPVNKQEVKELLTFHTLPTKKEIVNKAIGLVTIAVNSNVEAVMIGGASYLMGTLESIFSIYAPDIKVLHAFSERKVVETLKEDGTVEKSTVFKHTGFIEV